MCEFKVFLKGEKVFEGAVYAKAYEGKVYLRDVIGNSREMQNCKIAEVDVASEKLTLSPSDREI
jgi:predicted RNA-binding protein